MPAHPEGQGVSNYAKTFLNGWKYPVIIAGQLCPRDWFPPARDCSGYPFAAGCFSIDVARLQS